MKTTKKSLYILSIIAEFFCLFLQASKKESEMPGIFSDSREFNGYSGFFKIPDDHSPGLHGSFLYVSNTG